MMGVRRDLNVSLYSLVWGLEFRNRFAIYWIGLMRSKRKATDFSEYFPCLSSCLSVHVTEAEWSGDISYESGQRRVASPWDRKIIPALCKLLQQ